MAQFKVKILKKIYFDELTGFGVFNVNHVEKREHTIIVGTFFDIAEGDFLEVEGEYVSHPRFGQQIKVNSYKQVRPEDKDGIIKYLASGRFKGLGKQGAAKIVKKFGSDTITILENNPERLREVKGVKKSVITEIKQSITENKTIRELTVKLSPYGIGQETIFKIFKTYQDNSLEIVEKNPYILIENIRGVGFKTADTIGGALGLPKNHPNRVQAGITYYLSQYEQRNGDLFLEEYDLIAKTAQLLDVEDNEVTQQIDLLITQKQLVREENPGKIIMGFKNFTIEKMIAQHLFNLSQNPHNLQHFKVDFDYISNHTSIELTDEQKEAVKSAVNNRITIITGGPGTGKTTIIRAVIKAFLEHEKNVLVAAPTGRAAKRVEEATNFSASTIHRLLKISPSNFKFVHNEQNPLKVDALIIDEFSMVDFFLFYSLLKATSQFTRLIIIGDKDQLPSVGPGNVLRDLIRSGYFDIFYLHRNFRQSENSLIIDNAYRINSGEDLALKPYSDDLDFVFIRINSEQQAMEKVLRILDYYKNDYNFNSPDIQVLVPMYRGEAGIDNLNLQIQEKFNQNPTLFKKERFAFKQFDKVMQLKNNYEKEIFNGEHGIVSGFDPGKKSLKVNFEGREIEYAPDELDELQLSYAVSVHKAQGSEYDMLLLVLMPSHYIMLNRELFYTAVTRAKKKIFLISDPETIRRAIINAAPSERKTLLPKRLKEIFEKTTQRGELF